MKKEEFLSLAERINNGTASEDEIALYNNYYDHLQKSDQNPNTDDTELLKKAIYAKIHQRIAVKKTAFFIKHLSPLTRVAAMFTLFILAAGGIYLATHTKPKSLLAKNETTLQHDIFPGGNNATLTLNNGKQIVLNSVKKGVIFKQGNITINKAADGQISYQVKASQTADSSSSYNSITTATGGQYMVILPDGTKAWLNARSSLKFPTAFAGKYRSVQLTGEGYFEVVKNKEMPFIVKANGVDVQVLGTHFNITAYNDEETVRTTLLEGSVKMSKNKSSIILAPGQQGSVLTNTDDITLSNADIEAVMAWRAGYFVFKNENIKSIMQRAARWYDIDVIYRCDTRAMVFGGSAPRYKNLSELLRTLELTGLVHFKVEGRSVTVMP